jgi:phosphoadenosine phosphosulfate reductase
MKKQYPFIIMRHPQKTMWKLIVEKMLPPTQKVRYCCQELKESANVKGGYTLTGVRRAESMKRAKRQAFEALGNKTSRFGADRILLNDNEDRRETEFCMQKNAYVCNPIIDWSDEQVWSYIRHENLPYCRLYDEGFERLGCIGCPMAFTREREREFRRWPGYERCYKRAFQQMLDAHPRYEWKTGEEVFDWWMNFDFSKTNKQPEKLFEEEP